MTQTARMGELLVESRILVEALLEDALLRSLIQAKPFGEILCDSNFVSQELIDFAVEIQEVLDNGTLSNHLGVEALRQIKGRNISLAQAVAELGTFTARHNPAILLLDLLSTSGYLDTSEIPPDIQFLTEVNYNQTPVACDMLLANRLVDEKILYGALRCVYLIETKFLTIERAIMALDSVMTNNCSVDEAMHKLGWTARTRLRA
jgi:hypothetical protein